MHTIDSVAFRFLKTRHAVCLLYLRGGRIQIGDRDVWKILASRTEGKWDGRTTRRKFSSRADALTRAGKMLENNRGNQLDLYLWDLETGKTEWVGSSA